MELEGRIWKEGKYWIVEVPSLDVSTQGKIKKEALVMIKDAVLELVYSYYKKKCNIKINEYKNKVIGIVASDKKLLLSLSLRRQREKESLTIREVSKRLGSKSPNAYYQYERGQINLSLDQYEKIIKAINPSQNCLLGLA